MGARLSHHLLSWVLVSALAASAAGCGDGEEPISDDALFESTTETSGPSSRPALAGLFDAGGHKLYIECRGTGSPTVVYLHGSVKVKGEGGRGSAARVSELLDDRHRVCIYDRANVGRSL